LPIKFWEIEVSDDPSEKWWAGSVQIAAEKLRRPILEGTEIALTVKIDKSRQMTVEAFIPLLNQSFVEGVFIPDPPTARSQLQQQLDTCFARVERIWQVIYEAEREDLGPRVRELQLSLEHLAEQVGEHKARGEDPDADLGPSESLRRIRVQLVQLEEQLEVDGPSTLAREVRGEARWTEKVVEHHGSPLDKGQMERLGSQLSKCIEADDSRGIKWVQGQLRDLRGMILENLPWFWMNVLAYLKRPGARFLNQAEANRWLARAEQAQEQGNFPELRNAVNRVWEMQPPDQVELSKQQAAQSGLRGS
jgi:molecular chaperone DnaK